jgi:hypothetical protein
MIKVNPYSTQEAQLQFEYIWTRQLCLGDQDMDQSDV